MSSHLIGEMLKSCWLWGLGLFVRARELSAVLSDFVGLESTVGVNGQGRRSTCKGFDRRQGSDVVDLFWRFPNHVQGHFPYGCRQLRLAHFVRKPAAWDRLRQQGIGSGMAGRALKQPVAAWRRAVRSTTALRGAAEMVRRRISREAHTRLANPDCPANDCIRAALLRTAALPTGTPPPWRF